MKKSAIKLVLSLLILPVLPLNAEAQNAVTEQEAHEIGVNAYLYFYSLVTMDITRKQSINIEPGKQLGKGPMNMFVNVPEYPTGRLQRCCATELRYSVFHRMARHDERTCRDQRAGHTRALLPSADARYVERMFSPLRVGERPALRPGTYLVTPPGLAARFARQVCR